MVTASYPAVGTGGLTDAQWSSMYGTRDGIIEDYVGNACALVRTSATNMCRVMAGKISVNGYVLEIANYEDLYCAPSASGVKFYTVAVCYDPALNVPDVGGARSALGPCRLIITDAALDTSGGKAYVYLFTIERAPGQALAATNMTDYRRWIGVTFEVNRYGSAIPNFDLPRGSVFYSAERHEWAVRSITPAGTGLEWFSYSRSTVLPFPSATGLVAYDQPAQYYQYGGSMVGLRGTLKRSAGGNLDNGSTVILGTMPVGLRPFANCKFITMGSGGVPVAVTVNNLGVVSMLQPFGGNHITYVQLDNVQFRVETP
jgi:hypothetical protein